MKPPSPIETGSAFKPIPGNFRELPLFATPVSAGFPSPAEDYIDRGLDLNEHLITHPAASFYLRVKGDSMIEAGIHDGDLLIVDRALQPEHGRIIIGILDGEFTVKRLLRKKNKLYLQPENRDYKPIEITAEMQFEIWGVVTYVIHKL